MSDVKAKLVAALADTSLEEIGRWRNGKLGSVYGCLQAGTEFCDFDCPYRDGET